MGFLAAALPAIGTIASLAAAPATGGLSTIAEIGMGASALGGITGAIGSYESGQAGKAQAEYQAEVAAQNQKLAQQSAQMASASGEAQAEQAGLKSRANLGAIRAAEGASGIDVNSGSAEDVQSSARGLGMLDQLTIRSNAAKTAYGYETQGLAYGGQQQLEKAVAQQAPIAGAFGAAGSLLSGAAGVSNQYATWQRLAGPNADPNANAYSGANVTGLPAANVAPMPSFFMSGGSVG